MRTQGGSPNLINGVSRQPPEVRLTSQLEESLNQFPTISRGLVPRNPAVLKGVISTGLPAEAATHLIDRDSNEQYTVTVSPTGIQVHNLQGVAQTVNTPNGLGYLAGATKEDLRALTVQDHTFILNRRKVVSKLPDRTPALVQQGLIHVVQGDYFTDYRIFVNGSQVAHYTSDGGPYENQAQAREAERGAKTSVIANNLVHGIPPAGAGSIGTAHTYLTANLPSNQWYVALIDNVIHIRRNDGAVFNLEVEAGSETRIRAHKGETKDYSELPRKAPNGFLLKIAGDEDTNYDDFYVKFEKSNGSAQGVWKEAVAPNVQFRIDPETMPHLLVREANGTFTFKQGPWENREVGDEETNPWPSFVGQRVSGLSFGNNRLGLHSGESLAQSRSGQFYNFWVESILTPLDTDPVDAAISYPEVSTINHVVPFSGEVILFTSSVPFRIGGGETVTQKTVSYDHLLSNTVSEKVRPVAAGSHLYFVNDTPSGCFVHEFSYDRAVDNLTAQCITDHVAGYVPPNVTMMEADGDLKMLMLVSEDEPNAIYVYKWLWIGNDKAQSAWQKWTVDAPIQAIRFYAEELVIVTSRQGRREILSINCHEAWLQGGPCPVYLDRQVERVGTYDPNLNETTFSLPYDASGAVAVIVDPDEFGMIPSVQGTEGNTLYVRGNFGGKTARIGFNYTSEGTLSPLLHRTQNNQGAFGNAVPGFTTTVGNLTFGTGETAYLRVELDRDYRKPHLYEFSAALVGTKTGTHGSLVLGDIRKPVSVMSKSDDCRIRFGASGPYPYSILSYAWSGSADRVSY